MPDWTPTDSLQGPSRPAPVVNLGPPELFVNEIEFTAFASAIFRNSSTHEVSDDSGAVLATLDGLDGWALGPEIVEAEWREDRTVNFPACLVRNKPVELAVRLRWPAKTGIQGRLMVTPTLDDDPRPLASTLAAFEIKDGSDTTVVSLKLPGALPNEIGRRKLKLAWSAEPLSPVAAFRFTPIETEHFVFVRYGRPVDPDFDSGKEAAIGKPVDTTVTGTPKRLDKLMSLLGAARHHSVATAADVEELLWKIHAGVNDAGGPPFFDAIHEISLTHNGDKARHFDNKALGVVSTGHPLRLQDQWLMWVPSRPPHWNTASCIGHVQLIKTMLAAVGIFTRRAWILPKTNQLPDGSRTRLGEEDLVCLGAFSPSKQQSWKFKNPRGGEDLVAQVRLMEPNRSFENFEACLRTPGGKLLPGGYSTAGVEKDHPGFITKRGFEAPSEVLSWWCRTRRGGFQRFLCWAFLDEAGEPADVWDRDGKHYAIRDYEQIVRTGKQLPPAVIDEGAIAL